MKGRFNADDRGGAVPGAAALGRRAELEVARGEVVERVEDGVVERQPVGRPLGDVYWSVMADTYPVSTMRRNAALSS